jgi:hypothetical protein
MGAASVSPHLVNTRDLSKTEGMMRLTLLFALGANILLGVFLARGTVTTFAAGSPPPGTEFSGMVWENHGDWHLNGSSDSLRLGEAISSGGLVTAGAKASVHSITILLPDGQRMLCECYEAKTCAQGFRVPAITPPPSPAVWDMFVGVRNVLLLRPPTAETAFPITAGRAAMAGNFELVAPISPQGEVSITPALRVLPAGQYSLSATRDGQQATDASRPVIQPLDWKPGQTAPVRVGHTGLYRIRVSDQAFVPRIEIELLAVTPDSVAAESAALKQVRETILNWSRTHPGWALHPFLRVYLESRSTR